MVISDMEIKVGPQPPQAAGVSLSYLRALKDGGLGVGMTHSPNFEAAIRGNVYHACNTAAITLGTALTATGVTFHLCNPIGSTVDLVVLQCSMSLITCSTAGTVVLALSPPSLTAVTAGTALTTLNAYGASGVGLAKSATTLSSVPIALRPICGGVTAAGLGPITDWVDGSIVVPPGAQLSVQGITIVGTSIIGMSWEEVPRIVS